jgi:hypothetical protein
MNSAGDVHFIVITIIFVLVTYSFAIFLQDIIEQGSKAIKNFRDRGRDRDLPTSTSSGADEMPLGRAGSFWIPLITRNGDKNLSTDNSER